MQIAPSLPCPVQENQRQKQPLFSGKNSLYSEEKKEEAILEDSGMVKKGAKIAGLLTIGAGTLWGAQAGYTGCKEYSRPHFKNRSKYF